MPIRENREYRLIQSLEARKDENKEQYIVEGYATTFDEPYVLFSDGETDYMEVVDRNAFENTDTSDVIFQYDHCGMVFARNKNGTLELSCDDHGLKVRADLSSTQASRDLYDAIDKGLINQMSFAFTVDGEEYSKKTHTRTIKSIKKLYDVSAVSIPANPGTDIYSARSAFDGYIEAERKEFAEAEERQKKIKRLRLLTEVVNNGI